MLVTKCDICEKEIKESAVHASIDDHRERYAFCVKCGKTITDFLNKKFKAQKAKGR